MKIGQPLNDLTGKRSGRLIAVKPAGQNARKERLWLCKCDCGKKKTVLGWQLNTGAVKSCGCLRGRYAPNLVGQRFGHLQVLDRAGSIVKPKTVSATWRCLCDCGNQTTVSTSVLRSGNTRSCGCRERMKHGHSRKGTRTPTYISWEHMLSRCRDKNNDRYAVYGGKGIAVCTQWDTQKGGSFANFLADMGDRPDWADGGIDRIDPDGNYEFANCRWATKFAQAQNQTGYYLC